jgi:hypothetical protein
MRRAILVIPEKDDEALKRPLKKEESKPKSLSFYTSTCGNVGRLFCVLRRRWKVFCQINIL